MSKYLARLGLLLVAAAILVGAYLPKVNRHRLIWPLTNQHFLLNFGVLFGYIVVGAGLVCGLVVLVAILWDYAKG